MSSEHDLSPQVRQAAISGDTKVVRAWMNTATKSELDNRGECVD